MNPGFFEKMPRAEYDEIGFLNFSRIKYLGRSPLAFRYNWDNPKEQTPTMKLGNVTHTAILEPDMLNYAVWPGPGDRRGNIYKDWALANAGKTLLNMKEANHMGAMKMAVRGNPIANKYLRAGKTELTMVWRDPKAKRDFKARIDNYLELQDEDILVSLKSTVDCRDFRFAGQYAKMGYHCQDALYQSGFFYLTGRLPRMVTIAVENNPPYETAVYNIPNEVTREGEQEIAKWMEILTTCERSKKWPGAVEGEQDLVLPAWAAPGGDFEFDDLQPIEQGARKQDPYGPSDYADCP